MHALAGIGLLGTAVIICLALYLLPAVIAVVRKAPDTALVIVLNVLLGWTLIAWPVCLGLALRRHIPGIQVINQVTVQQDHRCGGNRAP
jgi:hypothetical protein